MKALKNLKNQVGETLKSKKSYVLISPCRNEADFMRKTLDSVVSQSVSPSEWVIVDDGSTDKTPDILKEYAGKYPFIKVVTRENRGHRSVGPGVIDAFYSGFETVDIERFDFSCKFDLDLILPPLYFEILMDRMLEKPRIGTSSGKLYFVDKESGRLISEGCGDENSIGPTKFYRNKCFDEIGGFVREVMWDGIDGHRCRQLGWIAVSWDDEDLRVTHLRPMGSSQNSIITGRLRHGFGQYFMGTSFVYMLASAVYRVFRPPYLIGGLAMLWGYIRSALKGLHRFEDENLAKFIRSYQWQCLLKGKRKATLNLEKKGENIWLNSRK